MESAQRATYYTVAEILEIFQQAGERTTERQVKWRINKYRESNPNSVNVRMRGNKIEVAASLVPRLCVNVVTHKSITMHTSYKETQTREVDEIMRYIASEYSIKGLSFGIEAKDGNLHVHCCVPIGEMTKMKEGLELLNIVKKTTYHEKNVYYQQGWLKYLAKNAPVTTLLN